MQLFYPILTDLKACLRFMRLQGGDQYTCHSRSAQLWFESPARWSQYVHNARGTKEAKEDGHGGGEKEKKSMDRKKNIYYTTEKLHSVPLKHNVAESRKETHNL